MYSDTSFRDPAGFLYKENNVLYRLVEPVFIEQTKELLLSPFFQENIKNKIIAETELSTLPKSLKESHKNFLCMKHETVEIVSYPWEWSFDQLKQAALLTLDIQLDALNHNYSLKDATSLNILFKGKKPIFVDVLSFEKYTDGNPWIAYGQFCRHFLFPLMLTAYTSIDFSKFMLSKLGEISVEDTWKILGVKNIFKTGVFIHVYLQNLLQNKMSMQSIKQKSTPKLPKQFLINNILNMKKIIHKLKYPYTKASLVWANYADDNSYNNQEHIEKLKFVEDCLKNTILNQDELQRLKNESFVATSEFKKINTIIDFGANSGVFSRLAAQHANQVISVEYDSAALNHAFNKATENITHFLCDVTNPTPALGFNLKERSSFKERVTGDFFLALALIHHLRISSGIPLEKIIDCLFYYAPQGIIEWIDPSDQMVKQMLLNRENVFHDYTWENFQKMIEKKYTFVEVRNTSKVTRKLCYIKAKRI
jgi:ribosomal protein L11 methylase PrmA